MLKKLKFITKGFSCGLHFYVIISFYPLTYRGYTLTWQNGRQLASMRFRTINIGFTYDVDGLRTSKTIPNVGLEHKYYYVGDRLQYETLGGSSALWYFYDADGNPSGIRYKDNSGTVNDY